MAANFVTGLLDSGLKKALEKNKDYQKVKEELEEDADYLSTAEKIFAVILFGGIALFAVGMGYCAGSKEKAGGLMIGVAVPTTIVAYSCYQASENFITQVEEDPLKLMTLTSPDKPIRINKAAVQKCIMNKTLFFRPVVNFYMRHAVKSITFRDNL